MAMLIPAPAMIKPANAEAVAIARRCLRANLRSRYGRRRARLHGSPSRYRWMSRAKPLAVSYRRVRFFSSAFITIQSSSPRTSFASRAGSVCRDRGRSTPALRLSR